jgi:multidrug resistance protein MdtO
MGFLAIMYLVPHMESIVSLVLLVGAVTALAGWVAAGSERIAYAGVQIGFAFYFCIFQGYKPGTDFDTIRDRLVGIVLGLVVSTVVFHYLWPEHAVDRLRAALARALRNLARLLVIPGIGATIETERQAAAQLRSEIAKDLDSTLHLSELAVAEDGEVPAPDGRSPAALEGLAHHTQAVSLVATALSTKTELEEWQRLEQPAQEADAALRSRAAEQLQRTADSVANSQRPQPDDFESTLTTRIPPTFKAGENDRTRLLRHLVEQMQRLAPGTKTAPI